MPAVWYDRQGAASDVLVCGELPTSEAGHGEVRVRLKASGVNPSDTYRRRGPPAMEYPRVVTNSDGAGVVDQIGPGVPERWLGKRVWLYNGQRTAAGGEPRRNTSRCCRVSFAEGATLGVPGMTAHRSVFVAGRSGDGTPQPDLEQMTTIFSVGAAWPNMVKECCSQLGP
jgi:NADPH2:quinone reductase